MPGGGSRPGGARAPWTTRQRQQALLGAGVAAVGALMAWGATGIPSQAGYAGVGPNFLPWVVSLALLGCGGLLAWQARDPAAVPAPEAGSDGEEAAPDWRAFAWVAAGLLANAALLTTIGFILAGTLCYMLAVRGLRAAEGRAHGGAAGLARDFATGALIAAPAYWTFTQLLGINLPGLTGTGWL